ncbi:hypothetical protein PCK1_000651 [Pneumocystis canis]|nr:hypothetical protein PCK1_000651 [Pneumocystis canis]
MTKTRQQRYTNRSNEEYPNKRRREISSVLPDDFFDNPSNSEPASPIASIPAELSPPLSPTQNEEHVFDEGWEQAAYDERAKQLLHKVKEVKKKTSTNNTINDAYNTIINDEINTFNALSDTTSDTASDISSISSDWRCKDPLTLHTWQVLTTAVSENWGGPDSASKRDWLTGIIVDILKDDAITADEIEVLLLQVMEDEFSVIIDDGSTADIAARIIQIHKMCKMGDTQYVTQWFERWRTQPPTIQAIQAMQTMQLSSDDEIET